MIAADIHAALMELFPPGGFAYIKELRAGTGYSKESCRYLDAWVIGCFPSTGLTRFGIEIKVNRSDFVKELKNPFKRDSALRLCNEFYFAAPAGLISVQDLPKECGLIEVAEGKARFVEEAEFREINPATWPFVASLARRADLRNGLEGMK